MSLNVKISGSWKTSNEMWTRVGGAWKRVSTVWTRVGGAWRKVYDYFSVALVNAAIYVTAPAATPSPVTIQAVFSLDVAGTGPFTYLWSYTGSPTAVGSATGATFALSLTSTIPTSRSGTAFCTVMDSLGNVKASDTGTWELVISNPS